MGPLPKTPSLFTLRFSLFYLWPGRKFVTPFFNQYRVSGWGHGEEVVPSKKKTKSRREWKNRYAIFYQNGSKMVNYDQYGWKPYPLGRTHLYCPDKGVFPPIQGHSNYSPPQPFFAERFVIFQKTDRIVLTNFWLIFVAISVLTFCQISQKLRFFGNFPSLTIVHSRVSPGKIWENLYFFHYCLRIHDVYSQLFVTLR